MANRNRTAGHIFERDVISMLRERGWDVHTSRYASRLLDDKGVDIAGNYPRNIQCKASVNTPNIKKLLDETEADIIFWRKMEKKGRKFYKVGEYALLPLGDLLDLIGTNK